MANLTAKKKAGGSRLMQSRYFLYTTAFFSGMSVMAIELGASRLLAPYFSSSQIVWTVIIGTIMIALALGHVIGGRMVDKNPDPSRLYRRLLLAAVWTAAIPFAGKYVIAGISLILAIFVKSNFLIWASLLSCFLVFVFPLLLLGTVSPALIKFCVLNLEENGKVVGELEAISTIGSIIGTFLPTFVTIPAVGTAATFLIFAGILAAISLIYFWSVKRHLVKSMALLLIICSLLVLPASNSFAFWETNLLYEGESIYNYLQVKDTPKSVILSTNVLEGVQSIMMKNEELTGMYYDYALAAPIMAGIPLGVKAFDGKILNTETADGGSNAGSSNLLILGLGTGTYATQCLNYFPGIAVEGVEIDAKIVDLAKEYFRLPTEVQVSVNDGRAYLQNSGTYDVILVDAYQDITIPFQMSSREFFGIVKEHLKENGVMVVNMNMRSDKAGSINDYLCDTIASQFPYVHTMALPSNTNMVLFASSDPLILERLTSQIAVLPQGSSFRNLMLDLHQGLQKREPGALIFTDDKAPVELLGMQVIDELIAGNLKYYQDIMEQEGLEGLLRSMGLPAS